MASTQIAPSRGGRRGGSRPLSPVSLKELKEQDRKEHVMSALGLKPSLSPHTKPAQTPPIHSFSSRMSHKQRPSSQSMRGSAAIAPKMDNSSTVRNTVTGCRCKWREKWHSMNQLRIRQELCDIILISSDQVMFFAHASVLAANSSVLYSTIKDLSKAGLSSNKPRKLMLPSLKSDILGVVVDFIYGISPSTVEDEVKLQKGLNTLGFHKSYLPPPPWINMPQSGTFNVSEMLGLSSHSNQSTPSPKPANRTPGSSGKTSRPKNYVMDLTGDDEDSPRKNGTADIRKSRPSAIERARNGGTTEGVDTPPKAATPTMNGEDYSKTRDENREEKMTVDDEEEATSKAATPDNSREESVASPKKSNDTEDKDAVSETNDDSNCATSVKSEDQDVKAESVPDNKDDIKDSPIGTEYANEESKAGPEKSKFSLMDYHPYSPKQEKE